MNIFVLDRDPQKAARYHCDRHVVKLVLETAQILCTCHWVTGCKAGKPPYKLTHQNHPCTIWVRESLDNYRWLVALGLALLEEYTLRYQKVHRTTAVMQWLQKHEPPLPKAGLAPFAQTMPDSYKHKNPVRAYRAFYKGEKASLATWKTKVPKWWEEDKDEGGRIKDESLSSTYQAIYKTIRKIPRGRVATYGQVAELAGFANHARLVGYALHSLRENVDLKVPWHRVINARGEISLRDEEGIAVQQGLLEKEGVEFDERGRIDLGIFGWRSRKKR